MSVSTEKNRVFGGAALGASALVLAAVSAVAACSSSSSSGSTSTQSQDYVTCASAGETTPGAADSHCQGQPTQVVSQAACFAEDAGPSADPDAGTADDTCQWGPTMFGNEGDDDDCKYHVVWSSTALCEGTKGVQFTVTVTNKTDGSKVTGIPQGIIPEAYIPIDPTAVCETSTHPSPSIQPLFIETPAGSGTYVGNVIFDAPGQWTIRFHIHEECYDFLDSSPHGHAAFRVTLP